MKNDHASATPSTRLPWERQHNETSPAFESFATYRDMGPNRSLQKAATALRRHVTLLERWSPKNDWVTRANAYDAHIDSARLEAHQEAAVRSRAEYDAITNRFSNALLSRLTGDPENDLLPLDPGKIEWPQAIGMWRVRIEAERAIQPRQSAQPTPTDDEVEHISAVIEIARKHMSEQGYEEFLHEYRQRMGTSDALPANDPDRTN